MAERRRSQRQNGRAHLGVGNDLDAEDVGQARPAITAKGAEDEILAFLVEDENAGEHFEYGVSEKGKEGVGMGALAEGRDEIGDSAGEALRINGGRRWGSRSI